MYYDDPESLQVICLGILNKGVGIVELENTEPVHALENRNGTSVRAFSLCCFSLFETLDHRINSPHCCHHPRFHEKLDRAKYVVVFVVGHRFDFLAVVAVVA